MSKLSIDNTKNQHIDYAYGAHVVVFWVFFFFRILFCYFYAYEAYGQAFVENVNMVDKIILMNGHVIISLFI